MIGLLPRRAKPCTKPFRLRIIQLAAENLHFERSKRDMNTIQRSRASGAVCFLNPNGACGELLDRAGSLRLLFIAVQNAQLIAWIVERDVHNHVHRARIDSICVGDNHNFLIHLRCVRRRGCR